MDVHLYVVITGVLFYHQRALGQLPEPTETENNCFNGIMEGTCPQTTGRAFVRELISGVKYSTEYSTTNTSMCQPYWTPTVRPECCEKGPTDCYGDYQAVNMDPYIFHKDCVGKNKCGRREAVSMDRDYLTCDKYLYPPQTAYFYINFYCIDVSKIGSLLSTYKQNDGQGSLLYLWNDVSSVYAELPASTHSCSVETDCDETITITSLDFRFSENDINSTCIEGNSLTITDDSLSYHYNCSTSNNDFQIQTLFTSKSCYVMLSYTGITAGGYLWLALHANGNLSLNCPSRDRTNNCEGPTTTEEPTTFTETGTTTTEQSTTETIVTTTETPTKDQTTTPEESSTTMEEPTSSTETSTVGNSTSSISSSVADNPSSNTIVIVASVIGSVVFVAIIGIAVFCLYRKYGKKKKEKKKAQDDEEKQIPNGHSTDYTAKDQFTVGPDCRPLPQIPPTNEMKRNDKKKASPGVDENGIEYNNTRHNQFPSIDFDRNKNSSSFATKVDIKQEAPDLDETKNMGFTDESDRMRLTNKELIPNDTTEKRRKKKRKKNVDSGLSDFAFQEINPDTNSILENNNDKTRKHKKKKHKRKITLIKTVEYDQTEDTAVDENVNRDSTNNSVAIMNDNVNEILSQPVWNSGHDMTSELSEHHKDNNDEKRKKKKKKHKKRKTGDKINDDYGDLETTNECFNVNIDDKTATDESRDRKEKKKKKKKTKKDIMHNKIYPSGDEEEIAGSGIQINDFIWS